MFKKSFSKAFTLLESMLAITVISGIASFGYVGFIEINAATKATKLEQDIAVINKALRVYEAHGGELDTNLPPNEIIKKLKTVASENTHREIIGLRESMIDSRLELVMQSKAEASTRKPRALWDLKTKRFIVARSGDLGIESFRMNEALGRSPSLVEDRASTLKLAKKSNWVWDYDDKNLIKSELVIPINLDQGGSLSLASSDHYTGPLNLNSPSFSSAGGNYDLHKFEAFRISLSNPNPEGSSRIFYSLDGNNWSLYSGQNFEINPGDRVAAMAASLEPGSWADSGVILNAYNADPVQLEIGLSAFHNPINYEQLGGKMASSVNNAFAESPVLVSLLNSENIPNRYQNSDHFKIAWSFDGSDPVAITDNIEQRFSGGFAGTELGYTLDDWGKRGEFEVKVVAKSLNSGILTDSPISEISIGIDKIRLGPPIGNVNESGGLVGDQKITMSPLVGRGSLPKGWRIYYTSDGTDPGHDSLGEPIRGTLYSGPIDPFKGSSDVIKINARVYGPEGYAHWFNPSSPYSFALNRWHVPEWEGYLGGIFHKSTHATFHNIRQHRGEGGLDLNFDPRLGLNGPGKAIAIQPNGKAIAGGQFTLVNGLSRNRIVRFNLDGSVDKSFDPGEGFDNEVLALLIQPDGKIVVGGKFKKYNNKWRMGIARLNSDGTLDDSFQVGRGVHSDQNGWVHSLAIQNQNMISGGEGNYKIIVAGCFTRYNFVPAYSLASFHSNVKLDMFFDTSFGVQGIVHSVCTDEDGDIVIGGFFDKYDGVSRNNVARVKGESGRNDSLFNPGDGANDPVYTVNVYEGGKLFIGGSFDEFDGNEVASVARLNSDGSHDSSFHLSEQSGIDSWTVYSSHVTQDDKVFVGGKFHAITDGYSPKGSFIRLDTHGSIDSSYSPGKLPIDASVFAISVKSEGEAIITGDFPETYVKTTENIARINTETGQIDDSFRVGAGANGEVKALIKLSDGNLLVGGEFTRINGVARLGLAKLNADGEVLEFSSQVEGGSIYSIVERSDGKIVIGGSFQSVGGNPSLKRIARLNPDGSVDASFDPPGKTTRTWVQTHPWKTWVGEWRVASTGGFDGTVRSVSLLEGDEILAVGEFNYYGEQFQPRLALLDSDAGINEKFSAFTGYVSSSGSMHQALVLNDGRILLVGNFTGKLKCLLKDGSLDSSFVPENINGEIRSAVIQKDGRILIGGNFTKVGSKEMNRVAVLNRNGSLYNAFDPDAGADGPVTEVLSLRDGGSVVLGAFRKFGSQERVGIVRLMKDGSIFSGHENNDLEITSINSTR
ncbi:MAG: hypothetical protein GWP42_07970 [Verrucomicrobiales bacterium]|nr:hypothetical protein [Verrucomicrobiales bacterium]